MSDNCFLCAASGICPHFQYGVEIDEWRCSELIERSSGGDKSIYRREWDSYMGDYNDYDDVDKSAEIKHILSSYL